MGVTMPVSFCLTVFKQIIQSQQMNFIPFKHCSCCVLHFVPVDTNVETLLERLLDRLWAATSQRQARACYASTA